MKKIISLLLGVCMLAAMMASCQIPEQQQDPTHTFKTEWEKDATHHWHACEDEGCTETSDKAEHTWGKPTVTDAKERVFTCTACGETKTEVIKTTVTAEEWAAAFDLGTNWSLFLTATHPTYNQTMTTTYTRDNNKFYYTEAIKDNNTGEEESEKGYAEIVENVWYNYDYDEDFDAYEKEASSSTVEENLNELTEYFFPDYIQDMASFTYDETQKAYAAETISGENEIGLNKFKFSFEDGKLAAMSYAITMEDVEVVYFFTFTYGDASVTIPAIDETKSFYKVIVRNASRDRVAGVRIQACKGDLCLAPVVTNDNGVAVFKLDKTENIQEYHVKIAKFPEGYTGDVNQEYSFEKDSNTLYIYIADPAE